MDKIRFSWVVFAAGCLLVVGALVGLWFLDRPLVDGEKIEIRIPEDDTLTGTYYPGTINRGVLLLEGFGSDQTAMRLIAAQFVKRGYHALTFDFSGHGRSPGGLDFDNAATNRLAIQTLAADATLRTLSGLTVDQIVYLGHSLGARVGLQASTLTGTPPSALILLGTQVNLTTNVQAEFFTGTQDRDLAWVQLLGPSNPSSDIYLISGRWDDILTPESARLLASKLSGLPPFGEDLQFDIYQSEPLRYLLLHPNLPHNYEIYGMFTDPAEPFTYSASANPRILYWLAGIAGLFLAVGGATWVVPRWEEGNPEAEIEHLGRFLLGKALLWIPALIPGALIASAVFFAPLGTPVFNLYYIGFFGGYGVLLWLLYWMEKMPGVSGKISFGRTTGASRRGTILGMVVFLLVLTAVSGLARSGWSYTFPFNHRVIWLIIFTPITSLSFVIGFKEIELLGEKRWPVWLNGLIGLLPFFLYTGFLAALGSLSGVVSSLQGLAILALAILTGNLVYKLSRRPWMAALCQAFLLYWLILPQGVLFR